VDRLIRGEKDRAFKSDRSYFRILFAAVAVIIVVVVGVPLLLYLAQNKMVFPGGRVLDRTPDTPPFGWSYEDLMIDVGVEKTNAWFIPASDPRGVVLFSHGNAGTISDRLESVMVFRDLGFSVLLYDYGGYGRSTGRASEARCYEDIRAMWRYLTEQRGIASDRILFFGRSLGGGPTVQLATEVRPSAVILESTFLSIPEVVQDMFRWLSVQKYVRTQFDNASKLPKITAPILIVHSPDDRLIQYRHGQGLFERANEPKHFLEIRGDHNEGFVVSWKIYRKGLADFLMPLFPQIV